MLLREIVDQIHKSGISANLHVGQRDEEIAGIAVTYTPSLDVLRKAVAQGSNLIVSREGPFWNRKPESFASNPTPNPTFIYKRDFIDKNHLAILQLRDDPRDDSLHALAEALGWGSADSIYFQLPPTTLEALTRSIQAKLNIHAARVIGDPHLTVRKVALTHGRMMVPALRKVLQEPALDAIVIGEPIEWEATPYFQDLIATGQKKGLIAIGLEASEEPGGKLLAQWLKKLVPAVPVQWIPAGEPFTVLS